jgi:hypothetical protein
MKVWFQEPDETAKSTLKRSQEMVTLILMVVVCLRYNLHVKQILSYIFR